MSHLLLIFSMTNSAYILSLLENMQDPNKDNLVSLYTFLITQFPDAKGSSNNKHQWREWWYYDHIADSLKFGKVMYDWLQWYRALPFSFDDVIIIIALHDYFEYNSTMSTSFTGTSITSLAGNSLTVPFRKI